MRFKQIFLPRLLFIALCITLISVFIANAETTLLPYVVVFEREDENNVYVYIDEEVLALRQYLRENHSIIIYIDPGHGGVDSGTDIASPFYEKYINFSVALMLYEMFLESDTGIFPILSRQGDYDISRFDRAAIGSALADVIVSIHANSFRDSAVRGVETYYDVRQELSPHVRFDITSHDLALAVHYNVISATGAHSRGARDTNRWREVGFVITSGSTVPAILLEMGYLSNQDERALLVTENYQRLMALGIYNGIIELFTPFLSQSQQD
ncbi:MAG: N-acetylmuramoyl-L-alanine amidase [Defluviitaleaceae bacterium]|nr:N-acetylmuramoyl-L-alanine amidase [Defluviitaleaceae bacterium]